MSLTLLREKIAPLTLATGVLSMLAVAMKGQMKGEELEPRIQLQMDALLEALGVRHLLKALGRAELAPMLAEIRLAILNASTLLREGAGQAGWNFLDRDILQAAGETSVGFAMMLKQTIVPSLSGLSARLEGAGKFLDVGAGVAALSIAMARLWPALRVVGVEPWPPSVALARENLRAAACADRVEFREQRGEEISDTRAFDLAWVPSLFIPSSSLEAIVRRVNHALRLEGWLLLATGNISNDLLAGAHARLRTLLWGGTVLGPDDAQAMLERAGFKEVHRLPLPPSSPIALYAGKRV